MNTQTKTFIKYFEKFEQAIIKYMIKNHDDFDSLVCFKIENKTVMIDYNLHYPDKRIAQSALLIEEIEKYIEN